MSKKRFIPKPRPRDEKADTSGLRVLDVGAGPNGGIARIIYPDATITLLDAPGTGADIEVDLQSSEFLKMNLGPYDIIVCAHVIEHLHPHTVDEMLAKLYSITAPDGQIIVKVPSLEWAASQITSEHPTLAVLFHLYGGQRGPYDVHKWAYTLPALRNYVHRAGYVVSKAGVGRYEIVINNVKYPAEEGFVVGIKPAKELS